MVQQLGKAGETLCSIYYVPGGANPTRRKQGEFPVRFSLLCKKPQRAA
jgi:hypothetical protein